MKKVADVVRLLRLPKIRVEVRHGPRIVTWLQLVQASEIPDSMREFLKTTFTADDDTRVWLPALRPGMPEKAKCRLCKSRTASAATGLCSNCFETVSSQLKTSEILLNVSDYTLNRMLDEAPSWLRLLSRFGRPKFWISSGRAYGIVPGREDGFCNSLNVLLGLQCDEKVSIKSLGWFRR